MAETAREAFSGFFQALSAVVAAQQTLNRLPLVGDRLSQALPDFSVLSARVDAALGLLTAEATAAQIAAALDQIDPGITARTAGADVEISINYAQTVASPTLNGGLDLGVPGIGLNIDGSFAVAFSQSLTINLRLDTVGGGLTLLDNATPEFNIALLVDASLNGVGNLGPLQLRATDQQPGHEIALNLSFDMKSLDPNDDVVVTPTGRIDFREGLKVSLGSPDLPFIATDLALEWNYANGAFQDPKVSFDKLGIGLGGILSQLAEAAKPMLDIIDSEPFKQIYDALIAPLPIADEGIRALGLTDIFDKVPVLQRDYQVSFLDLYALKLKNDPSPEAKSQYAALVAFTEGMSVLRQLAAFRDSGADLGDARISLGDFSFTGGADRIALPDNPDLGGLAQKTLALIGDQAALKAITNVASHISLGDKSLGAILSQDSSGLTLPLLERPLNVLRLLLPDLFGAEAVTFANFDIPAQPIHQNPSFPFGFPPLQAQVSGQLNGYIDFSIGYDSRGIINEQGDFDFQPLEGLYIKSNQADLAIAKLDFGLRAGLGLGAGTAIGAYFEGGIDGTATFSLPADGLRISDIANGYLFTANGKIDAVLDVLVQIDFGLLSYTDRFDIVRTTIVDFDSSGGAGRHNALGKGLASVLEDSITLRINAGVNADGRQTQDKANVDIADQQGDIAEVFNLSNALDAAGNAIIGAATLSAFGLKETYGSAARPLLMVVANDMGAMKDALVAKADFALPILARGGGDGDHLEGGAASDTLDGADGADIVLGGAGDDVLHGGNGDDVLTGGAGADLLDGGDGNDTVSYRKSQTPVTFDFVDGKLRGQGGDATGDTLESIEFIVGSDFNDRLVANRDRNSTLVGGDGNDTLSGYEKDDYLLGGAGADVLDGGAGRNATSYIQSRGAVRINLPDSAASGGDAQGDKLYAISDVQGSGYDDLLVGDALDNSLDGWNGNDRIEGGKGRDSLTGGFGDDTVFGGADNDTLDGGPGTDLLSYEKVADRGVTVNLRTGVTNVEDVIAHQGAVSSFENLTGTSRADDLTGDVQYNLIKGGAGDDVLHGDDGNDTLIGGVGRDALDGGTGIDLADYSGSVGGVIVRLSNGTGQGGDAEGDTLTRIENLRGTDVGDTLIGDDAANEIDPGLTTYNVFGADSVDGMGGTDILVLDYSRLDYAGGVTGGFDVNSGGGSFVRASEDGTSIADQVRFGNIEQLRVTGTRLGDTLFGGDGGDLLLGGGGDDVITAGLGPDQVYAGDGDDRVISGTDPGRQFSVFGGGLGFFLDGGAGIDTLSISLSALDQAVTLAGTDGRAEGSLINLSLPGANGIGIVNFELLGDVLTGQGADAISQPGQFDNILRTGDGTDTIAPGLGTDVVDGGGDYVTGREVGTVPGLLGLTVIFAAGFAANDGDLLRLNYADVASAVAGSVRSGSASIALNGTDPYARVTNAGSYASEGGEVALTFTDIERMEVTGSRFADLLVGSYRQGVAQFDDPSRRGRDVLSGGAGNDTLIGNSGSDTLFGGDGDDTLIGTRRDGTDTNDTALDFGELDELWGGAGADRFMLGFAGPDGATGYYYRTNVSDRGEHNWAQVADFNPGEGDLLVLSGRAADYVTTLAGSSTYLFHVAADGSDRQLIAEVRNTVTLELGGASILYLQAGNAQAPAATPQVAEPAPQPQGMAPGALALLAPAPSVTATANPTTLLASLFSAGTAGLVTEGLVLNGDARAFGTFQNDLLGQGSGILLSTGRVSDLVGANLVDGGLSRPANLSLSFEKVGRVGDTDLYRADLSHLGIDLRSLSIQDGNSRAGGSPGVFSGFDLNAVVLSRSFIDTAGLGVFNTVNDLNDTTRLTPVGVFDFSNASTRFSPGTQHAPTAANPAPDIGRDLDGTRNGLVDFAAVSLGRFDGNSLTMGDGGSVSFNLASAVSTDGPLYLYVGESGAIGEDLTGSLISASASRYDSAAGDLSTDFGLPGIVGDTTSLTYTFHKAAGSNVNMVAFQFALFSEELREFAGSDFNDSFRITLNGVNLAQLGDGAALTVNNLLAVPLTRGNADLIINPIAGQPGNIDIRADSYTRALTFQGALQDGTNTLTIEVRDARDGLLDSGILVKAGSLGAYYQQPRIPGLPVDAALPVRHILDSVGPRLAEGQEGGKDFTFTVTRVNDISVASDVDWRVTGPGFMTGPGGLPTSATGTDFEGGALPAGRLHFEPWQSSGTITVRVAGDRDREADESFGLEILSPSAGTVVNELSGVGLLATATILNDDVQYFLASTFRGLSLAEGSAGPMPVSFVVSKLGDLSESTVVPWLLGVGGTDSADAADFAGGVLPSGQLSFAPGETAQTITLMIEGDTAPERDESFSIFIIDRPGNSYPYSIDGGNTVAVTILDDDRGPGGIELVSANAYGQAIGGLQTISSSPNQSGRPTISADGRYAVFDSYSMSGIQVSPGIFDGPTGNLVFRKDMLTGELILVSAARDATTGRSVQPDALYSHSEAISANGRYVAFISGATNLEESPKDSGYAGGVFVRDMLTGEIRLALGAEATAGSANPSQAYYLPMVRPMVSDDGNTIAFIAQTGGEPIYGYNASGLYTVNPGGLYVINLENGTVAGGYGAISASMSADATSIAFTSFDNIGIPWSSLGAHLYVEDLVSGAVTNVTNVPAGQETYLGGAQYGAGISADGRYVVTAETIRADLNATDIGLTFYRKDLLTGDVTSIHEVAVTDADTPLPYAPSVSADGRFVVYLSRASSLMDSQVFVTDLTTGATAQVVGTAYQATLLPDARSAVISADGDYIVFNSISGGTQVYRAGNPLAPAKYALAGDSVALEGEALHFTVTRTRSDTAETIEYTTDSTYNTATAGQDYIGHGGQIAFAVGETLKTITVQTLQDGLTEILPFLIGDLGAEYLMVSLVAASGEGRLNEQAATATGVIIDTDSAVDFDAASLAIAQPEGDGGGTAFRYVVTRAGGADFAQTVTWSVTGSGTRPADAADFADGVLPGGTVTFAPGAERATIDILVAGDTAAEGDEGFTLRLGGGALASGIITNDDLPAQHSLAQAGVQLAEGSTGVTLLHFTIARAHDLTIATTVDWSVAGTGANPVSAADFLGGVLPRGTVFFLPGQAAAEVTVRVTADRDVEADETLAITLSNPSAGTLGEATAIATLRNDDATIGFASADTTLVHAEDAGTFSFAVRRTGDLSAFGSVNWSVTGSGVEPSDADDFEGGILPQGTLIFAPGVAQQTITLRARGDIATEPDEGFTLALSGPDDGTVLGNATARGSILNDDLPALHTLVPRTAGITEGAGPLSITVLRQNDTTIASKVAWNVIGTGTHPADAADFIGGVLPLGSVSFAPGETEKQITLALRDDGLAEPDETFALELAMPPGQAGGTEAFSTTVTIRSNDPARALGLSAMPDYLPGGPGEDVYMVEHDGFSAGDLLDGRGGVNRAELMGAGLFDLSLPQRLANLTTVIAQELQTDRQTVVLRDGLALRVEVASGSIDPANPNRPGILIEGSHAANVIQLGRGDARVVVGDAAETVLGGGGNNVFVVDAATIGATIDGGTGASALEVRGGGLVRMNASVTRVGVVTLADADLPYDFVAANGQDTFLVGSAGSDRIITGDGRNFIQGGAGDDWIGTGAGDDIILGGEGRDTLAGGGGDDTYRLSDIGDLVLELPDGGVDTVFITVAGITVPDNVEIVRLYGAGLSIGGSAAGDILVTDPGGGALSGNAGDDTLYGQGGDDGLDGGDGRDTLLGGAGRDTMSGGDGDDVMVVTDAGDVTIEAPEGGFDTVWYGTGGLSIGLNIEVARLFGGAAGITGNAQDNIIVADPLGSRLEGADGGDTLWGQQGPDTMRGDAGDDVLRGQGGNDDLSGGAGRDQLVGGAGADIFRFDRPDWGYDQVFDFSAAEGDKLNLAGSGVTSYAQLEVLDFGGAFLVTAGGNRIDLYGVTSLSAADFLFV